jgi:hypothetical protein
MDDPRRRRIVIGWAVSISGARPRRAATGLILKKRNKLFILFPASDLPTMTHPRDEEGLSWTTLIAPPNAQRFLPELH